MTPRRVKDVLWVLALLGLVAGLLRLGSGLGATTDLSDGVPWGLWKVVNMIAGVALATGGFVLAFVVHVLGVKSLRPVLRPALLLAFLGYGASCLALLLDIGLPWRFWHPFLFWNPHSFLFEVFWCVSLYFTVTTLEVGPIALEDSRFPKVKRLLAKIGTPVVILGITFSTLHHTTLGSLFLVSPDRLHEIWYTSWLPVEFILSAVGAGMLVVVLLTLGVARLYRREAPMPVLTRIAGAAAIVLSVYLATRILDLATRGVRVFSGQWESKVFLVEIALSVLIPVAIIAVPRARRSAVGLGIAGTAAALGLVLNRVDVGILGYLRSAGVGYHPTATEIALTIGIPAAAGLVFLAFVERFRVFELGASVGEPAVIDGIMDFEPQTCVWRKAFPGGLERVSLLVLVFVPVAVLLFTGTAAATDPSPVRHPRGVDAARGVLLIDGDRNGEAVRFPHDDHKSRLGGEASCAECHHLDLPGDRYTACNACHSRMETARRIFDHDLHVGRLGGNRSCADCHAPGAVRSGDDAKACVSCHEEDMRMTAARPVLAPGYVDALHESCVGCHEREREAAGRPDLAECSTCHGE